MDISIKEPCHENWSDMTPNQQGAFCGKCMKTVVDFSTKTVDEIKIFFNSINEQNMCGRFKTTQLKDLSFDDFYSRFSNFHFSKRILLIICLTFAAWLFGSNNLIAQTTGTQTTSIQATSVHEQVSVPYVSPISIIKPQEYFTTGPISMTYASQPFVIPIGNKKYKKSYITVPTKTLQPKSVKKK